MFQSSNLCKKDTAMNYYSYYYKFIEDELQYYPSHIVFQKFMICVTIYYWHR